MPGTLSQLVDELLIRAVTPGASADMTSYVNATIRESSGRNRFFKDMIEDEFTSITTETYTWENIPVGFRRMHYVKYNRMEGGIPFIPPGKQQERKTEYWYEAGNYKVFSGIGGSVGSTGSIQLAYFKYPKRLVYYAANPAGTRPVFWDKENEKWQYWNGSTYVDTLGTTALDEAAREKVTNWLINDWYDMISNGGLAKFYLVKKDERGPGLFSLYKNMQNDMEASEVHETGHHSTSGRN